MIIKFKATDLIGAYNGYDCGKAIYILDGDAAEVSDEYGKELIKTFPDNFSKGTNDDLPVNRAKIAAEKKRKKEIAAYNELLSDTRKGSEEMIVSAENSLKNYKKKITDEHKEAAETAMLELRESLKSNDIILIDNAKNKLKHAFNEIDKAIPGFNKLGPSNDKMMRPSENK